MSEKQPELFDRMLDGLDPRAKSLLLLILLGLAGCAPAASQAQLHGQVQAAEHVLLMAQPTEIASAAEANQAQEPVASEFSSAIELERVSNSASRFIAHTYFNLYQSEIFNQVETHLGVSGVCLAVIDDQSGVWQIFRECYSCNSDAKFFTHPADVVLVFRSEEDAIAHMVGNGLQYNIVFK